jgi:large subunit ribosomal protein L7/L12
MTEENKKSETTAPEKEEEVKADHPKEEKKEKKTEKVVDKAEKKVEVPAKFKDLVKQIEDLSIMDLAELVKVLEKKFGVSPMMAAAAVPVVGNGGSESSAEEKSEFNIEIKDAGSQKIQVIKVVREITGKGLKEAKNLVDAAPKVVKENAKKEEAEEIKKKLEEVGAIVELK